MVCAVSMRGIGAGVEWHVSVCRRQWLRNDEVLPWTDEVLHVQGEDVDALEGYYQCRVSNTWGTVVSNKTLVRVAKVILVSFFHEISQMFFLWIFLSLLLCPFLSSHLICSVTVWTCKCSSEEPGTSCSLEILLMRTFMGGFVLFSWVNKVIDWLIDWLIEGSYKAWVRTPVLLWRQCRHEPDFAV